MDPLTEKHNEERRKRAADIATAIKEDTEASLVDPVNKFTAASQEDPCKCFNNMNAMLRMIAARPESAKYHADLVKEHNVGKQCAHVWHYKRIISAVREYQKPREF